ncbi:hypothetical protein K435DRAFT_881064 [Dendrothele bispora CBS 962.96]|uniref:Uncharacterized protein n=1 Tax=Dendrothele bispora (strain CBS 962.96) TaxID=1314807 RepID=A0A4S8KIP6_DENBC|nr:hypothetical protein K435DRAFT_881064 [Dendrothele bispora CBS 962.96]
MPRRHIPIEVKRVVLHMSFLPDYSPKERSGFVGWTRLMNDWRLPFSQPPSQAVGRRSGDFKLRVNLIEFERTVYTTNRLAPLGACLVWQSPPTVQAPGD